MESTGARAVSSLSALLQSTAPDAQQLEDAAELLSWKIPSRDEILNQSVFSSPRRQEWRPLDDRILKWLLAKLSKQDKSSGSCFTDPTAYTLLHLLLLNCPEVILVRHLQHVDIVDILCSCLTHAHQELESIDDGESKLLEKKSKKRKRPPNEDQSTETRKRQILALLIAICGLFDVLLRKDDAKSGIRSRSIKDALKLSIERAGLIVEAGLSCVLGFRKNGMQISDPPKWSQLVRPLLSVWESATMAAKAGEELHCANTFAKHCLVPSLVLQTMEANPFLEIFIKQYCLLPIMQPIKTTTDIKDVASNILVRVNQYREDPNDLPNVKKTGLLTRSDVLSSIPLLIKLVGQCQEVHSAKEKAAFSRFVEELSIQLAQLEDIDFDADEMDQFSTVQSQYLNELLAAYQSIGYDPGEQVLSKIVLRSFTSSSTSFSDRPWRTIKLCLELRPSIIVESQMTVDAETIKSHILSQIDTIDQQAASIVNTEELADSALRQLLEPLLEAMIPRRELLGFVPLWKRCIHRSLSAIMESGGHKHIKKSRESFWERRTVQRAIESRLSRFVSSKDLYALIESMLSELPKLAGDRKHILAFYTQIMMWPAIRNAYLESLPNSGSISQQNPMVKQEWTTAIYSTLVDHYNQHSKDETNYMILELLNDMLPEVSQEAEGDLATSERDFLTTLCTTVEQAVGSRKSPGSYECAATAWSLLSGWLHKTKTRDKHELLKTRMVQTWRAIDSSLSGAWILAIQDPDHVQSVVRAIHGQRFTMQSPTDLLYGCIHHAVSSTWLFDMLDEPTIRGLLKNLYMYAYLSSQTSAQNDQGITTPPLRKQEDGAQSWNNLWSKLLCSVGANESPRLHEIIQSTRITSLIKNTSILNDLGSNPDDVDETFYYFVLDEIQNIDLRTVPKQDRGKMINQLTRNIEKGCLREVDISCSLRLLHRLLKYPTMSASLLADSTSIWTLGESLGSNVNVIDIDHLRSITKAVIEYWTSDSGTSSPIIESFFDALTNKIKLTEEQPNLSKEAITSTSLGILRSLQTHQTPKVDGLCLQFLQCQLRGLLATLETSDVASISVSVLLQNISSLPMSTLQAFDWQQPMKKLSTANTPSKSRSTSIHTQLENLEQALSQVMRSMNSTAQEHTLTLQCWSRSRKLLSLVNGSKDQLEYLQGIDLSFISNATSSRRKYELINEFQLLSPTAKGQLLTSMADDHVQLTAQQLLYLRRLVSLTPSLDERTVDLKSGLQSVMNYSLAGIEQGTQWLCARLGLTEALLAHNPWVITQEHIDRILALIGSLTSRSCKAVVETSGSVLLERFIRLSSIIFQNYRTKIGGRWHLVLDALRGILRCSFVPYPNLGPQEAIPQPLWIQHQGAPPIAEDQISYLGRLLTSICDPTHKTLKSSSKTSHQKTSLNDASKTARAIAGQHMQHFIGEFCSLQLKGKMSHAAALEPGLYAIFDAMSQDVRKSLNESLDPQSRMIFKGLYDKWNRFGKWTGT